MALNIANDYMIFDNLETITFQNKGESAITISDVMRRPSVLGVDDGGGNVVYGAAIEFLIWKQIAIEDIIQDGNDNDLVYDGPYDFILSNESPSFVPRLNAIITDNLGKRYTVDSIDDGVLRTRWSIKATSYAGEGVN